MHMHAGMYMYMYMVGTQVTCMYTLHADCMHVHALVHHSLHTSQGSDLIPGENYPCPQSVPDRDKLGKGGNGTVVKFPLGGTEYALKWVSTTTTLVTGCGIGC